jgi:predicted NUDIX family NTP pyrophosphohydrolase
VPKFSAGILLFKKSPDPQVLLVHPGGPFWARKDNGAWSVPKGEYELGQDALEAAKREFKEETAEQAPTGRYIELGEVTYGNKRLVIWAVEGSAATGRIKSNTFEMEWPPKSGKLQVFAEVDRTAWFSLDAAKQKLVKGQVEIIDRLDRKLSSGDENTQVGLFG